MPEHCEDEDFGGSSFIERLGHNLEDEMLEFVTGEVHSLEVGDSPFGLLRCCRSMTSQSHGSSTRCDSHPY